MYSLPQPLLKEGSSNRQHYSCWDSLTEGGIGGGFLSPFLVKGSNSVLFAKRFQDFKFLNINCFIIIINVFKFASLK